MQTPTEAILRQHSIEMRTDAGRLMALEVIFAADGTDISQWVDVSRFSVRQVYQWLGY